MSLHPTSRLATLALAAVCAACGGGSGATPPATPTQPESAGTTTQAPPMSVSTGGTTSSTTADTGGKAAAPTTSSNAGTTAPATPAQAGMSSVGGNTAPATTTPAAGASGQATAMTAGTGAAGMSAPGDDSPMLSPGCMGGTLKAGRTMGSIQSSGGNRTFIQYVPRNYDGTKPVPLLVDLHPFSVGASFAESSSGFKSLSDTEGYIYLAPQGKGNEWDSVGDVDEKFIRDLVNDVAKKGCVDLRRVYATGCSNGGAFSFLLLCTAEDMFAAVAPMCGTAFFDIVNKCTMDRPASLMLRIGRSDTLNCWEGEGKMLDAPNVEPGTKIQCAKTIQKLFTEKYHCKGQIKKEAQCEFVGECDEGTEVAICNENTGHVVYSPSVAKDTWAFLKKFYKH